MKIIRFKGFIHSIYGQNAVQYICHNSMPISKFSSFGKKFFSDDFDSLLELKNNDTLHKDVLDIFLNQQSKHNIGRGVYTWTSDPHSPAEQSFYSQTFIPTDIV